LLILINQSNKIYLNRQKKRLIKLILMINLNI